MKFLSQSIITAIILFAAVAVPAQTGKNSVWAVDFVKTKRGEQTDYLKFIEQNWAKARIFMKEKGIVASYRFVSVPADEKGAWDVLLITEYLGEDGYGRREAVFDAIRRHPPAVGPSRYSSRPTITSSAGPFSPPSGPKSIIQSAHLITSILCSIIMTESPCSTKALMACRSFLIS